MTVLRGIAFGQMCGIRNGAVLRLTECYADCGFTADRVLGRVRFYGGPSVRQGALGELQV